MSTQEKGEEGFELVTFTLLNVVYSRLSYPLGTLILFSKEAWLRWLTIMLINQVATSNYVKLSFISKVS
jgi:hypothetical protein